MHKSIRSVFTFAIITLLFLIPAPIHAGEMENYGILDAKNHDVAGLPRAIGNGIADDTQALRQLTRYGFLNRMVVILPSGTYRITDQIEMVNDLDISAGNRQGFVLWGSTKGARPTIVLDANSPGFNNDNQPKAVINMWRRCDTTGAAPCASTGELENPENFFNSGLRNLNIKIKSGNAGAVAIRHAAAQRSYQEDISIDMTESGYAGYLAIPGFGSSSINDIEITGGKYGFYLDGDDAHRPTISNITLTNQTVAAIYTRPRTDFVVTGFKITKQNAPAIVLNYGGVFGSGIIMVDGTFEFANATSAPAITSLVNSTDEHANTTLYNVYFNKATNLIKTANKPTVTGNSSGWTHLTEYFVPSSHNDSYTAQNGIIDNTKNEIIGTKTQQSPTVDLRTYHTWARPYRSPDHLVQLANQSGSGVCNALNPNDSYTISDVPTNNSRPGLQLMIESPNCTTIFLPRGDYFIDNTLTLGEHTQLQGLGIPFTFITSRNRPFSQAGTASGWLPTSNQDFITTVNSASADTWISDIRIAIPTEPGANDWLTYLHWRAGRNSVVKNIDVKALGSGTKGINPKADVKITGNGGGKWFGASSFAIPEIATTNPQARRFLISGTTEPLNLYNFNLEDGKGAWQGEFRNAKNISIYGSKYEDARSIGIFDSENIVVFGSSKFKQQRFENTNNILVASATGHHNQDNFITEVFNGTTKTYTVNTMLALYRRGNPQRIQIPATIVPTTIPTNSLTTTPAPTLPPAGCTTKNRGNADCRTNASGNAIDILDYAIWYSEFIGGCSSTALSGCGLDIDGDEQIMDANFNFPGSGHLAKDMRVNVFDYAVWIQGFVSQETGTTPTPTGVLPTVTPTPTSGSTTPTPTRTPTPTPNANVTPGPNEILVIEKEFQFSVADSGFHIIKERAATFPNPPAGRPAIPSNWKVPQNYWTGTWNIRYIVDHPSRFPGKIQICMWDFPGFSPENCAPKAKICSPDPLNPGQTVCTQDENTYLTQSIPANLSPQTDTNQLIGWYKVDNLPLSFTTPRDYRISAVLQGFDNCSITTKNVSNPCWEQWPNFQNTTFRITAVMVPQEQTFSGWHNYP